MSLTTDPHDPRLKKVDPDGQQEAYLVLSPEERAQGFVRPLYRAYLHVGIRPRWPLRDLTPEEHDRYDQYGYLAYEEYPPDDQEVSLGRYWTEAQLTSGCRALTTMALELCETYARDPGFYGATFCCHCQKHLPVTEFEWVDKHGIPTGVRVGS